MCSSSGAGESVMGRNRCGVPMHVSRGRPGEFFIGLVELRSQWKGLP